MSTPLDPEVNPICLPNTMGLPCMASAVIVFRDRAQLTELQDSFDRHGMPLVLAGASNVILPERVNRPVVLMRNTGLTVLEPRADAWLIDVAAGHNWHQWVCESLARGWPGLENLALIPGSVGAAPIQNIGAYGLELAQRVAGVEIWDFEAGQSRWIETPDCRFGYRDSVFKQAAGRHWLVLNVRFALPKDWQPVLGYPDLAPLRQRWQTQPACLTAQMVFDHVVAVRQAKLPDPAVEPNVGSFFKNPVVSAGVYERLKQIHPDLVAYRQADEQVKLAAGWLIDQCGFKGKRFGAVAVHARQALVLVNTGGARMADVLSAADAIAQAVSDRFGVRLQMEPVCVS